MVFIERYDLVRAVLRSKKYITGKMKRYLKMVNFRFKSKIILVKLNSDRKQY